LPPPQLFPFLLLLAVLVRHRRGHYPVTRLEMTVV
jgi:hypothetical protein